MGSTRPSSPTIFAQTLCNSSRKLNGKGWPLLGRGWPQPSTAWPSRAHDLAWNPSNNASKLFWQSNPLWPSHSAMGRHFLTTTGYHSGTILLKWARSRMMMNPVERSKLSPAEALLWDYGISDPADIDLDAIAFDMGATVHRRPLCGCEARLVADGNKAVITINSKPTPPRPRFSLPHAPG